MLCATRVTKIHEKGLTYDNMILNPSLSCDDCGCARVRQC